jgi:hypothetical protein
MAVDQMCNYANCTETCERGVVVSLRVADPYDHKRAAYCCVSHAVASLARLAKDRCEEIPPMPRNLWAVR